MVGGGTLDVLVCSTITGIVTMSGCGEHGSVFPLILPQTVEDCRLLQSSRVYREAVGPLRVVSLTEVPFVSRTLSGAADDIVRHSDHTEFLYALVW